MEVAREREGVDAEGTRGREGVDAEEVRECDGVDFIPMREELRESEREPARERDTRSIISIGLPARGPGVPVRRFMFSPSINRSALRRASFSSMASFSSSSVSARFIRSVATILLAYREKISNFE